MQKLEVNNFSKSTAKVNKDMYMLFGAGIACLICFIYGFCCFETVSKFPIVLVLAIIQQNGAFCFLHKSSLVITPIAFMSL